jgi:hypothetical protein
MPAIGQVFIDLSFPFLLVDTDTQLVPAVHVLIHVVHSPPRQVLGHASLQAFFSMRSHLFSFTSDLW